MASLTAARPAVAIRRRAAPLRPVAIISVMSRVARSSARPVASRIDWPAAPSSAATDATSSARSVRTGGAPAAANAAVTGWLAAS
jgi:hypothetical protein